LRLGLKRDVAGVGAVATRSRGAHQLLRLVYTSLPTYFDGGQGQDQASQVVRPRPDYPEP